MNIRTVNPDGFMAALFLAFLATAGLFYVNLGGAFLSAFVDGLGISRADAGFITSANKYGAAFGALLAVPLIRRIRWRKTAFLVLPLLILIDIVSFSIYDPDILVVVRFLHGTIGGFLVGIGLSVIARLKSPEKGYGMLLAVQYSIGSIGIFTVPKLVGTFGPGAAFGALIIFSLVTLLMVPFIPDYPAKDKVAGDGVTKSAGILVVPLALVFAAIFLFQTANMGVADYMFELGKDYGYSMDEQSTWLAWAGIIAVLGGVFVYLTGNRFGRTLPILLGIGTAATFTFAFHWADSFPVYFVGNAVTGITWAFCMSYLLALAAAFDRHGQMAALAGFVSKMGLASGPFIGALVVGEGNFSTIINLAVGALILCALLTIVPALRIDREQKDMESSS